MSNLSLASLASCLKASIFGTSLGCLRLWKNIFVFVNYIFVSLQNIAITIFKCMFEKLGTFHILIFLTFIQGIVGIFWVVHSYVWVTLLIWLKYFHSSCAGGLIQVKIKCIQKLGPASRLEKMKCQIFESIKTLGLE